MQAWGWRFAAEYAAQFRQPGHRRASFEYLRAMHGDAAETIQHRDTPVTMPVLAIGAEGTLGQRVPDQVAEEDPPTSRHGC